MKITTSIVSMSLLAILCLTLSAPAFADLYNNGPTKGTSNAYFIDVFAVSDSFKPNATADITNFTFAEWVEAGATPLTVDWTVSSTSAVAGSILESGKNAPISAVLLNGGGGIDVYDSTVSVPSIPVKAGQTYWLTLTNATDSFGGRDAWDINSGPSQAFHNLLGHVPSESFTINGGLGTAQLNQQSGTTPEPSSVMLFGSGMLGLAGFLRRKISP